VLQMRNQQESRGCKDAEGVRFTDQPVKTRRVVVTAAGIISPLGPGLAETLQSLRLARDCVTPVHRFSVDRCRCKTAGQIGDEALANPSQSRGGQRLHRASHMMISALGEALRQDPEFNPEMAIIGTTSGGMSFGEDYYRALYEDGNLRTTPAWIANYPLQKPAVDALQTFGLTAPCQVIANACASGTNAIGHAFQCIRSGRYERLLTGGYDALSELVFVGFDSLQAATPEKCRPFDRERSGMVLGEGAAILALEELEAARHRGARVLAEITGYGISTDNHHLTQPEPSGAGPRAAMEDALQSANIRPDAIDYINAHGTATPFNDAAEGKAIAELFDTGVAVSSTKAMMGHSLGAAGAIEAVICILALQHGFMPANLNFRSPDEGMELDIVENEPRLKPFRRALSNSFGFGGTNASIVLEKAAA
jgi:3-oxoacyl-[acyl-carrier-protein] synthase II